MIDNGTFDISATSSGASIQSLSGSGGVTLGAQTLTSANGAFSGAISGTGGLTLAGGTNTHTGPTTVNAGALFVDGSIASSSLTTVIAAPR